MIRITMRLEDQQRVFRIDGQLTAGDLPVVDRLCVEVGRPDVLDLTDLQSVDAAGSERLRELASSGVALQGASPYLRLLLDNSG